MNGRERCLVTGGGGFVGKALCRRLVELGHDVISLSRSYYPELDEIGVTQYQYDLGSEALLPGEMLHGVKTVFHTAAYVKMWGPYDLFYQTNVIGTRKLLEAAERAGVKCFIYTSSPSVIANGTDLNGVNEQQPYPDHYEASYPETKAMAEQEVLLMNCQEFFTCSLRPHLIYGPGDTNLIPAVLKKAKIGSLKQIGDGENLVDFTYIDDCVEAHIRAAEAMISNPSARGRSYFISQGDPYPLWKWINKVLGYSGLNPIKSSVSFSFASRIAGVLEAVHRTLPFLGEPRLTRFLVSEMATSHYFDISLAKKLLGYQPSVTVEQGLEKTFDTCPSEPVSSKQATSNQKAVGM